MPPESSGTSVPRLALVIGPAGRKHVSNGRPLSGMLAMAALAMKPDNFSILVQQLISQHDYFTS